MQPTSLRPNSADLSGQKIDKETDSKLSLFFLIKSFNESVNSCERCNCLSLAKKVLNIALPIVALVNLLILPFIVAYNCCCASNGSKLQIKSTPEPTDKTTDAATKVFPKKEAKTQDEKKIEQETVQERAGESDEANRTPSLVTTTSPELAPAPQVVVPKEKVVKQDEPAVTATNPEPAPAPQAVVPEEKVVNQDEPAVTTTSPELAPAPPAVIPEEKVVNQDEPAVTPTSSELAPAPQVVVLEEKVVNQDEPAMTPRSPEFAPAPPAMIPEEKVVNQDEPAVTATNPEPAPAPQLGVPEKEISAMDKFLTFEPSKPLPSPHSKDDLIGIFIAGKSNPVPPTRLKSASTGYLRAGKSMSNVNVGTSHSPGGTNTRKEDPNLSFAGQVWGQAQNLGRVLGVIKE